MIRTRNLTKRYASGKGIFGVNLDIPRGETWALTGPSGCGKTTLIHTLTGLSAPQEGSVDLGDSTGLIGLVQQKDALFPWLTVMDNILLGLKPETVHPMEKSEAARDLLKALGISETADRYPSHLSGGQKQRASIARALIRKPGILLMDEPSASLDAFSKEALQDLLLELLDQSNVTTLFVTHSVEEALFLGRTVLVMKEGKVFARHNNPLYPDPDARNHKDFYSEVIKLRQLLKEASLS